MVARAGEKGAVASWSPTGRGTASAHLYLDKGFLQAVFEDPDFQIPVGEATTAGFVNLWPVVGSRDVVDTYLLFGDPATAIWLPYGTAVEFLWFEATEADGKITLAWETTTETNNAGFHLDRSEAVDGLKTQVNTELIPSLVPPGSPSGAVYEFVDSDVIAGTTYYYWLEGVGSCGPLGSMGRRRPGCPISCLCPLSCTDQLPARAHPLPVPMGSPLSGTPSASSC